MLVNYYVHTREECREALDRGAAKDCTSERPSLLAVAQIVCDVHAKSGLQGI